MNNIFSYSPHDYAVFEQHTPPPVIVSSSPFQNEAIITTQTPHNFAYISERGQLIQSLGIAVTGWNMMPLPSLDAPWKSMITQLREANEKKTHPTCIALALLKQCCPNCNTELPNQMQPGHRIGSEHNRLSAYDQRLRIDEGNDEFKYPDLLNDGTTVGGYRHLKSVSNRLSLAMSRSSTQ